MEQSPRPDFKGKDGFGEKIRTTVKDSEELPKLSTTSRTNAVTASEEGAKRKKKKKREMEHSIRV